MSDGLAQPGGTDTIGTGPTAGLTDPASLGPGAASGPPVTPAAGPGKTPARPPVPPTTTAAAPPGPHVVAVQLGGRVIQCATPALSTGFGPIQSCTEVSGDLGRTGAYSPLTNVFNPPPDWSDVGTAAAFTLSLSATDGQVGTFVGFASLLGAYGPVVFGAQYQGNQGRFGNYNLIAGAFFPSGDWLPIA